MASIQKRPNGSWRARYRDETGREICRHFPRKLDAQRWLDGITAAVVTDSYCDPRAGKVTLATFYTDWAARQVWADNTVRSMSMSVRMCSFSGVELGKIRRSHVESWIKGMTTAGLAASTIRTRYRNVHGVLRGAVRDRLIARDPAEGVQLPRQRRAEHAMVIPTTEDVGKLMDAAEDWFRPFLGLCGFAGLRLGEASAVQLGDIDFLRRTLHVQRQIQRGAGGGLVVTPPKHGSERVVYLPDELLQILAAHIQEHGTVGPEQWLFWGQQVPGQPPSDSTVKTWWTRTLRDAGLRDRDLTLHTTRHFYASALIASGCDVVTVQRALGHSSASITLTTYSHLWPTAEDKTRQAAGAVLSEALRIPADCLRTKGARNRAN